MTKGFTKKIQNCLPLAVLTIVLFANSPAVAQDDVQYDPFHPQVVNMVKDGVSFLDRTTEFPGGKDVGGRCLVAYTILKYWKYESNRMKNRALAAEGKKHPQVATAVDDIRRIMSAKNNGEWKSLYMPAMAIILLCELDSNKYKREIKFFLDHIESRQLGGGGWSYDNAVFGDTSQSQYCALAMWLAKNKGFKVKTKVMGRALNWFMKTQTGNGGFVYHPQENGGGGGGQVTLSMSAAGMGSVYILEDALRGAKEEAKKRNNKKFANFVLPPTVTFVISDDEKADAASSASVPQTSGSKQRGKAYFNQFFDVRTEHWNYYYLYGLERYQSFREKDEQISDESPAWYNGGVKQLILAKSGKHWLKGNAMSSKAASTCFAVLFLIRSTKTTLPPVYDSGELNGGQGLAEDVELSLRGGKVTAGKATRSVDNLLASLDSVSDEDLDKYRDSLFVFDKVDKKDKARVLAQMRVIVSHKKYQVRLIGVRYLGEQRDFDSVPSLIYALSDPSVEVATAAHDALRFISRKFESITIPKNPDADDFKLVAKKWKDWYKQLVPDAVFRN